MPSRALWHAQSMLFCGMTNEGEMGWGRSTSTSPWWCWSHGWHVRIPAGLRFLLVPKMLNVFIPFSLQVSRSGS